MPTFKVTFLFNADRQGWSELWYWSGVDLSTAGFRALDVASARRGLLGQGTTLEAIRISDEAIRNDSLIEIDPAIAAGPGAGNAIRDTPGNAWLTRITATALYRRQVWLRGIPDSWIVWDNTLKKYEQPAVLLQRFNAFKAALVAKQFQIRGINKDPLINPVKPVTAVMADPSGVYKITSPAHGLSALDYIRIRGMKGDNVKQFNGVWQIFTVDTNTFLIPNPVLAGSAIFYKGGGTLQRRTVAYFNIDGGTLMRPAIRKTGRAFFVPAGRRPVPR